MSSRGYTPLHDLISALIDQVVDLRLITEAYIRTQVTFEGEVGGKRHVTRPESATDRALKLAIAEHRQGLNDWYHNLMKEVNANV